MQVMMIWRAIDVLENKIRKLAGAVPEQQEPSGDYDPVQFIRLRRDQLEKILEDLEKQYEGNN